MSETGIEADPTPFANPSVSLLISRLSSHLVASLLVRLLPHFDTGVWNLLDHGARVLSANITTIDSTPSFAAFTLCCWVVLRC